MPEITTKNMACKLHIYKWYDNGTGNMFGYE